LLEFFRACFSDVSRRRWFVVVFSWLFFGFLIIGAVLASLGLGKLFFWPLSEPSSLEIGNAFVMFLWIFLFNLTLSGFLLLTASGVAFFGLPIFFLLLRAFLWGVFLAGLSMPLFLFVFPTVILEGLGYVLAGVAGLGLGLSWFKPKWMFKEESLSRWDAFKRAVRECAYIYVFVVVLLLAAAIVETATLVFVA
jgi:hypothetical protein